MPKNYHVQGGDEFVVGGKLTIEAGADVTGITTATIVDALTSDDAGKALSAKQGKALKTLVDARVATLQTANATVAASDLATAVTLANALQADLNTLIGKLKTAGLMAST